jgi:hypothetical protein
LEKMRLAALTACGLFRKVGKGAIKCI